MISMHIGGEGGIRTPDTVARMPHFECGAFDHSATSPACSLVAPALNMRGAGAQVETKGSRALRRRAEKIPSKGLG
jgi:hypothetical protein